MADRADDSMLKATIQKVLADVGASGVTDAVRELIKKCAECNEAKLLLGIVGAASMPVLIPAVLLVGTQILVRRR